MIFTPLQTHASFLGDLIGGVGGGALLFISDFVSTILSTFFGLIIYLEAQIIDYLLSSNNFSFINAPIVKIGWTLTRDLANMLFILILLIIAFATVLRMESYGMKRLLPKLIMVAILINFSLVFAGFVIDFSQVVTTFFIKETVNGDGTITLKLMNAMKISNFYNPSKEISTTGLAELTSDAFAASTGIILTLVGLIVTVFVFGATAIFLVLRIINIWWLLIVLPIIIALSVVRPSDFSNWFSKFFQWTFFAPTYAFFIYLSMSIFTSGGDLNYGDTFSGVLPNAWKTAAPIGGLTTASSITAIFQWVLAIVMMFYALIYAQKSGVWGGAQAQKILKGWGNKAQGWAGRQVRQRVAGLTQPLPAGAPPPTGVRGLLRRAGAAIGGAAVAVPGARGAYLNLQAKNKKDYEDAQSRYRDVDPVVLEQAQKGILDPRDRLAIQQTLMEKKRFKPTARQFMPMLDKAKRYGKEGDFLKIAADKMSNELTDANGYTAEQREDLVRRAKNNGIEKEFYATLPIDAAKVLNKSLKEIVGQIKSSETFKINKLALENDEIRAAMAEKFIGEHIMNAAKEDRTDIIDAIEKGIEETGIEKFETANPRLAKWIQKSPGSTFFKINLEKEEKKEEPKKEAPAITVVGSYAKIPPPGERKG